MIIKFDLPSGIKQTFTKVIQPLKSFAAKQSAMHPIGRHQVVRIVSFVGAFAFIGVALLVFAQAATNTANLETEDGALAGAELVSDASASGGGAVRFGSTTNILQGKVFTADVGDSTSETGNPISNMTDGNLNTRWISQPQSPVNATIDLQGVYSLNRVVVTWAADTIRNYQLQMSVDGSSWTTFVSGVTNNTQKQETNLTSFATTAKGRYLRIVGTDRWNTAYGNSIWEAAAYGSLDTSIPVGTVSGFTATAASGTSATLNWNYSGATLSGFILTRNGAQIATPAASARSYTDSGVGGGSYTYTLKGNYSIGGSTNTVTAAVTVGGGGNGTWLSGAGDDTTSYNVANGSFETWRGEYVGVGGTWFDNNQGQVEQWSIVSGGVWYNWNRPLDMAIGAIDDRIGESWAAAANGAYDARWRQSAQNLKKNWTDRGKNESYLMVRFAHELNGNWYPWKVRSNEAASFKAAWIRWSNIMDEVVPQAKKVLSFNKNASSGMATARDLWPGKQYVDVYSVDYYNAWPHCVDVGCIQSEFNRRAGDGNPWGLETHRLQALEYGVPLAISEWGNSVLNTDGGGGAESPEFMTYMNNWMRANAGTGPGQLYYEIYFNLWDRYQINGPLARQPQTAERYRSLTWGR